jgi:hypothetical protein
LGNGILALYSPFFQEDEFYQEEKKKNSKTEIETGTGLGVSHGLLCKSQTSYPKGESQEDDNNSDKPFPDTSQGDEEFRNPNITQKRVCQSIEEIENEQSGKDKTNYLKRQDINDSPSLFL